MLKGSQPIIYGDGNQRRDFIYVGDCVRANMLAQSAMVCGIFNISTGTGTKINDLFDRLRGITHYRGDPKYVAAIQGEVLNSSLDASKAARELGWQPEIALDHGLIETVVYIKQTQFDT
jgi:UDP-glucose 4-epimerase